MFQDLFNRINSKKINVAVVGLGYVGLPLAIRFSEVGYRTYGIEYDKEKVNLLKSSKSYIDDISHSELENIIKKKIFIPSNDFQLITKCSVIVICVPTPLDSDRVPDLSYIQNAMKLISPFLKKGQLISLESTTYPGTTEEILLPIIEDQNFNIGEDFFLVYSPERVDPGNKKYKIFEIPKVVGGITNSCTNIGENFYANAFSTVITVSSTKVAEMSKLLENIHRAVNISLVNEMKMVSDKMGINIREVIDAASSKPFGFTTYYPGPGLGGHCIPVDPLYLTWKAKQFDIDAKFIEIANQINVDMPNWIIKKITDYFIQEPNLNKNKKCLILGVAYKKDISDTRESPALAIIQKLVDINYYVDFSDPYVNKISISKNKINNPKNIEINKKNLLDYDFVVLTTDHSKFDYDLILKESKVIFDTRGVYSGKSEKVIQC